MRVRLLPTSGLRWLGTRRGADKHVSLRLHSGAALPEPGGILDGAGATSRSLTSLDHDDLTT
jgi:hypothetical protein